LFMLSSPLIKVSAAMCAEPEDTLRSKRTERSGNQCGGAHRFRFCLKFTAGD